MTDTDPTLRQRRLLHLLKLAAEAEKLAASLRHAALTAFEKANFPGIDPSEPYDLPAAIDHIESMGQW